MNPVCLELVLNIIQASASAAASAVTAQKADLTEAEQLANIVKGLTGIDLSSIGLRELPKLESRKKKNGTATAGAATVSDIAPSSAESCRCPL